MHVYSIPGRAPLLMTKYQVHCSEGCGLASKHSLGVSFEQNNESFLHRKRMSPRNSYSKWMFQFQGFKTVEGRIFLKSCSKQQEKSFTFFQKIKKRKFWPFYAKKGRAMAVHVFKFKKRRMEVFSCWRKKHGFGVRNSGKKSVFFSAAFLICTKVLMYTMY